MGSSEDGVGVLAGGGPNNSRFGAGSANIMTPTTAEQANTTFDQAQAALAQQQALAQALQGTGQQGIANQSSLAQALQQQAMGQGPNPAQAQLAQATGANTANQAALMASQRGAGQNVGLAARNAGLQGAANQQGAAGQAATMQAQQQLAAQQQLQALSGTQVGQQMGAVNAYNSAAQGEQGNVLNAIAAQNNAQVGMQSNMNNTNAAMAQTNANNSAKFLSGALNGIGGAAGQMVGMGFAKGGEVPDHLQHIGDIYHSGYALGGPVVAMQTPTEMGSANAISNVSQVQQPSSGGMPKPPGGHSTPSDAVGGEGAMAGGPMDAVGMVEADPAMLAMVAAKGAMVPGKAKVKGDSPKNDTVPAMLSPGEIVIPRHVLESDDPVGGSAKFVEALLAKHGKKSGKEQGDFKEALGHAIASRKKK